jgi:colicin import membrane protein
VRCAPSGTVLSATLARSSGNSAWDAAALHAVEKTGTMPPDNDGKTPTSFTITMKPRN